MFWRGERKKSLKNYFLLLNRIERTQKRGGKNIHAFVSLQISFSCLHFKETVSQELWWVLLYINGKLFSGAIVGHHKILILQKGHFAIYKRKSSILKALQFQIDWTILDWRISYQGTS